ncbi:FAS1-like dehydratase domain-containing protein [Paraburkholderia sp. GAS32]|uniref:FAS1-like dehydratase domain-containing protein n=1 Tax=Paraburkholderia sp. GAS32 TaxID=3035129 RepID=UPI003D1D8C89
MTSVDIEYLRTWVGRTETRAEWLAPTPATLLAATLDHPEIPTGVGNPLPALFQWLYFLPAFRQSQIDADGHPVRGGLLPPVPLPRRMWAASTIDFKRALTIGDTVTRRTELSAVNLKQGRSGPLVFVTLRAIFIDGQGREAIDESQELVYRHQPAPGDPPLPSRVAPCDESWSRTVVPDPTLLFRYSALTFNSHRIHYDVDYARNTERYPALVVHGPLSITLLLDLLQRELPGRKVTHLSFRALSPLFEGTAVDLCGRPELDGKTVRLWTRDAHGALCTEAIARIE